MAGNGNDAEAKTRADKAADDYSLKLYLWEKNHGSDSGQMPYDLSAESSPVKQEKRKIKVRKRKTPPPD